MIAIGCDHAGYVLKKEITAYLDEQGLEYKDFGSFTGESCDYPNIGEAVGVSVASGECESGLLFCGTGIGISMAANNIKGVRAAVVSDYFSAKYTKAHNNANILAMGGRVVGVGLAIELVKVFLETEYEGGRHQRRLDMLTDIENKNL